LVGDNVSMIVKDVIVAPPAEPAQATPLTRAPFVDGRRPPPAFDTASVPQK
jgi:hypothetical protein